MDAHQLSELVRRSQLRWPAISPPANLEAQLLRCMPPTTADASAWFASGPADELYLASACYEGSPAALTVFERELIARVGEYLRHLRPTPDLVDEVKQRLREWLFVGGSDGRAKIFDYTARGPLSAWVRVVTVRIALQLLRQSPNR